MCDHIQGMRPFPRKASLEKRLGKNSSRGIAFCSSAKDKGVECGKGMWRRFSEAGEEATS